jgi:hypothetical protein
MTLSEILKKNVEGLPLREQARIFSEAFRASPKAQAERRKAADEAFGCLSEDAGEAMEAALWAGRRMLPETPVDLDERQQ